jgi:GNAT superfamily N-acetyltransferase
LSVRERREDDLPACVRVLQETHIEDGYPVRWPADPADWLSPPELQAAWVAERHGDVLGHVCVVRTATDPLEPSRPTLPSGRWAAVSRLFVAQTARRQKTGGALLGTASTWATAHGLQLKLDVVDDSRPAIELYERLGWLLIGRCTAGWTDQSGIRPMLRIYRAPAAGEPETA